RAVDEAGDDLAHVKGPAGIDGNDAVEILGGIQGVEVRRLGREVRGALSRVADDVAGDGERMAIVIREVGRPTRYLRVDFAAPQLFGGDDFPRGGFHQRRAAEEDRALVLHDDRLVAHRRDIRAARGARAHYHGDLRDAPRREVRLVVEDAAEVLLVREHLVLQ